MFTEKERLSTWRWFDKESDIVLSSVTDFPEIGEIEHLFLLTFIDNTFSFKIFSFSNTRFLDLEGFTDIRTYHRAVDASSERVSVCCREEDIRKR